MAVLSRPGKMGAGRGARSGYCVCRLEVALIGGRKLFFWPDSARFEDKPMSEFVSGSVGTGKSDLNVAGPHAPHKKQSQERGTALPIIAACPCPAADRP